MVYCPLCALILFFIVWLIVFSFVALCRFEKILTLRKVFALSPSAGLVLTVDVAKKVGGGERREGGACLVSMLGFEALEKVGCFLLGGFRDGHGGHG